MAYAIKFIPGSQQTLLETAKAEETVQPEQPVQPRHSPSERTQAGKTMEYPDTRDESFASVPEPIRQLARNLTSNKLINAGELYVHRTLDQNLPAPKTTYQDIQPRIPPEHGLGQMESFPVEIFHIILPHLDVQSLSDFGLANRQARLMVESVPQFQEVQKHGRAAFIGALAIGSGRFGTLHQMWKKLCQPECDTCGAFAGYLYLLTYKRACYACFVAQEQFNVAYSAKGRLSKRWGLSLEVCSKIPQMVVYPGTYGQANMSTTGFMRIDREIPLADETSARRANRFIHGRDSWVWEKPYLLGFSYEEIQGFHRNQYIDDAFENHCQAHPDPEYRTRLPNPLLFTAIVRLPWFNGRTSQVEWGFYCRSCSHHEIYPQLFSIASFQKHVLSYPNHSLNNLSSCHSSSRLNEANEALE